MKAILFLTGALMLGACTLDGNKKVDREKFQFKMGDDSELFFKNVRAIYYDRATAPDGKTEVYRFADRYTGQERPLITPAIVINWLEDEAYVLIENNEPLDAEPFLSVRVNDSVTVDLRERGRERMLEFGSRIYEGIQKGQDIRVKQDSVFVPLFATDNDREAFRVTLADYYRLTRVF
ncbi:MAG: hypothetical protein MUC38_05135 [Cyclobacteriaceae bacterium]|jgi:hypothetical protein|nr:hypothetical protein [Cyclobacteriaceae bacterium]